MATAGAERMRRYRAANLDKIRAADVIRKRFQKYNVTEEQWQAKFYEQGGRCAGCMKVFGSDRHFDVPCVDHDHETGKFRGLLCPTCNRGLGLLKDSVTVLQSLVLYLQA